MWKICSGVTYNLHNCHKNTALKLYGGKSNNKNYKKIKPHQASVRKSQSARFAVRIKRGWTTDMRTALATERCSLHSVLNVLSSFSHPSPPNIWAQNEKGKIRDFPPILDFKMVCFWIWNVIFKVSIQVHYPLSKGMDTKMTLSILPVVPDGVTQS